MISLIWGSGFGIIKQNRGKIPDWKYARELPVRWDAKNKNGITGLHEILRQDYEIEEPYWGPSYNIQAVKSAYDASLLLAGTLMSRGDVSGSITFCSKCCLCSSNQWNCKLLAFLWLILFVIITLFFSRSPVDKGIQKKSSLVLNSLFSK